MARQEPSLVSTGCLVLTFGSCWPVLVDQLLFLHFPHCHHNQLLFNTPLILLCNVSIPNGKLSHKKLADKPEVGIVTNNRCSHRTGSVCRLPAPQTEVCGSKAPPRAAVIAWTAPSAWHRFSEESAGANSCDSREIRVHPR